MSQTMVQSAMYREAGPSGADVPAMGMTNAAAFADTTARMAKAAPTRLLLSHGGPLRDEHVISSSNRYKYFKRPVIPFMTMQPPEVLFAPAGGQSALEPPEPVPEPASKDMACQSDYRESEAQTDPYSPEYVVPPGTDPELLTIASLKFGAGLPAGLTEVQMIERARQKREFEASLPPITDEASLNLRRKMMGEQELREWNVREEEIYAQQNEKLAVFDGKLREQAEARELHWDERIEHARQIKLTEKDKEISQIQRRRIKALRKLSEARKNVEARQERRDVVADYADYGSEVYAPLTRNGHITRDKLANQYDTKPLQLETLAGLQELERKLPARALNTVIVRPDKGKPQGYAARASKRLQDQLARTDEALKLAKQAKPSEREQKEALLAAYRDTKPVERPPTPTVAEPEHEEEVDVACILLQRLLRGRAIQNMMFEGKERRLELINELRSDELGDEEEQALKEEAEALSGVADVIQAELVGPALDNMSKELRRFKEERRIA